MATGTNVVAGKSTTSEDTTEIVADAPSPTIDFTGSLILKVGPQAGALSPRHDVTGIECAGSNGGGGITGVGGLDNGAGVSGYGGGGPITTGAGGVGVYGHGGQGSRAKNVDPGVGVIGVGGSGDVLSKGPTLFPSVGVLGYASFYGWPGSFGVSSGIGVVGLGGVAGTLQPRGEWLAGGPGVVGMAGGAAPALGMPGLRHFGVVGVGGSANWSQRSGPIQEGGTGVVGLAGGVGSPPNIDYAGVVAVGGPPTQSAPERNFAGRFGGPGVVGISGSAGAPSELDSADTGVYATGGYAGVKAIGNSYGIYAVTRNPSYGTAGYFEGDVSVARDLWVSGNFTVISKSKSVAIPFSDGSHRRLYCMESPESWFEDFGEAKLVKGKAQVKLEREFRGVIETDSYHVFVTPYGKSNGLYVSSRNRNGLVVEELNAGKSGVRFSYRIVGKRRDLEAKRFAKVVLPKLSDRSSPRTLRKTAQSKMKGKHKR